MLNWIRKRYRAIPNPKTGEPMLEQFMLWGDGKSRHMLALHRFIGPEPEGWYHSHRWRRMWTLVLCGFYVDATVHGVWHTRSAGRLYRVPDVPHRIVHWGPSCWTLCLALDNRGHWGYYNKQGAYVPWEDFVEHRL